MDALWASVSKIVASGVDRWKRTVLLSTTSTDWYALGQPPARGDFSSGSSRRSMLYLTAAALNGSPLWKRTPWRSLNSIVFGSGNVHDSANIGTSAPL